MRRNYREIVFIFAVIILTLSGCLNLKIPSKIIRTTDNTVIKKANSFFPIESFVIMSQEFLLITSCGDDANCSPIILNTFSSAGSGVIVKSEDDMNYVLTAGHICVPPQGELASTLNSSVEVDVRYMMKLTTGFGRESEGEIVAVDLDNDLCLLKSNKHLGPALKVSPQDPMLHEEVYNMANPAGLASSLAVPVFKGYYVGNIAMLSIYSIPAVGGSSGSPIMNKDNEIISIVSAAAIRFDEYAIGPRTEKVREFLLAHLPQ